MAAAAGDDAQPAAAKAEGARVPRPPPEPRLGDFLVGEGCICRAGEEEEELLPLSMLKGDSPAPSALQHKHRSRAGHTHCSHHTHCSRVRNMHKHAWMGGAYVNQQRHLQLWGWLRVQFYRSLSRR